MSAIEPVERTDEEIASDIEGCGVSTRFKGARKDQIPSAQWDQMAGFFKGKSFYVAGPVGVGKTHLVSALVCNAVIRNPRYHQKNGRRVERQNFQWPFIVSAPALLLGIRDSFRDGSGVSEADIINRYVNMQCLVIDDIGVEKQSEWVLQTMYLIIDGRYQGMRQTVITSNFSIEQLAKHMGDRIASRIAGMCEIIHLKGKDRRVHEKLCR